jgi:surface antigen
MKTVISGLMLSATMLLGSSAMADPIQINDNDEGYSRLARWEQHLDDRIADGVRTNRLDGRRAWRLQKQLDSIEGHVLQSYYMAEGGIDYATFRLYAGQLRDLGNQLGDNNWGQQNVYGNGWFDDRGGNYGPPPPPPPGNYGPPPPPQGNYGPPPPPPGNYYREGDYERSCQSGNRAAGTLFGAIAGGLIGGAASHGNGGAVAGGVILGGLLGNTLSSDISCEDHRYAFDAYDRSLNGDVGRDYRWEHGSNNGTFTTVREYRDGPDLCRDFRAVTYRDGQRFERSGTACRRADGNWQTR